jgi:hypothetical protein
MLVLEEPDGSRTLHSNLSSRIPHGLTLAVTTLVLNQARYLREWIAFHRLMGFQLFILFDDNSTDDTAQVLLPYIRTRVVILVHARESFGACARGDHHGSHQQARCQRTVFEYARSQLLHRTLWMGNFDVDEFIWTPRDAKRLPRLLQSTYAGYDRVAIRGTVFGDNNHSVPSPLPVIQAYTRRGTTDPPYDGNFRFGRKELYRPAGVAGVAIHNAWCWLCSEATVLPLAGDLRMNHYQIKSLAEQRAKAELNGNPMISFDPYMNSELNSVEDTDILYVLSPEAGGGVLLPN